MVGLHDPMTVSIDLLNAIHGFLVYDGRTNCIGRDKAGAIDACFPCKSWPIWNRSGDRQGHKQGSTRDQSPDGAMMSKPPGTQPMWVDKGIFLKFEVL